MKNPAGKKKSKSNRAAVEALNGALDRKEATTITEIAGTDADHSPNDTPDTELEAELKELRNELDGLRDEKPVVKQLGEGFEKVPGRPLTEAEQAAVDGTTPKKKRVKVERDDATDLVTAKDLADQVGVEPKILRRRLRKLQADNKITVRDGRWEWPVGSPDIKTILEAFGK